VLDTGRLPAGRQHLDLQTAPALWAKPGRFEGTGQ
jgi:hypothetical protein